MVVYEVKDTGTLSRSKRPKPLRKDITPALPVHGTKPVGPLEKKGYHEGRREQGRKAVKLSAAGVRDVKRLAEEVNQHLEKSGAGIHLLLIQEEDGFVLDVYDCSDGHVCKVIHDMIVPVDELQNLYEKLQSESGIIFDQTL